MTALVLTVTAADRPGLVAALSDTIAAHGGSWTQSRLARLAGSFAGVLLVDVEDEQANELTRALRQLTAEGVLDLRVATADQPHPAGEGRVFTLTLTGHDRPGIVREIAKVLAEHGATFEDLETWTGDAAMSAEQLFHAAGRVRLPAGGDQELAAALEAIANEIQVDIDLDDEA